MTDLTKQTLTQKIETVLSRKIADGEFRIGDILPDNNRLAKQFKCSPATAERSLRVLRRNGLVKRIRHKGSMVVRRPPKARVALILSTDAHLNTAVQDMISHNLIRANYELEVVPVTGGSDVIHSWCSRQLHTPNSPEYLVELYPSLATKDHPEYAEILNTISHRITFSIDFFSNELHNTTISIDPGREARTVVNYLLKRGHKRVAVWAGNTPESIVLHPSRQTDIARRIADLLAAAGGEAVPAFGDSTERLLRQWVKKDKVTAFYDLNDGIAVGTMMRAYRAGIRVPEDLAIIGRHDTPHALGTVPMLTSLSINPQGIARTVVKALDDMLAGKAARNYTITPKIIERGTA